MNAKERILELYPDAKPATIAPTVYGVEQCGIEATTRFVGIRTGEWPYCLGVGETEEQAWRNSLVMLRLRRGEANVDSV